MCSALQWSSNKRDRAREACTLIKDGYRTIRRNVSSSLVFEIKLTKLLPVVRVHRLFAIGATDAREELHPVQQALENWFSDNGKVVLVGDTVHAPCVGFNFSYLSST